MDFPALMPPGLRVIGSGEATGVDGGGDTFLHAATVRWGTGSDDWGVMVFQQRGNTATLVKLSYRYTTGHLFFSRGRPYFIGFRPDIDRNHVEAMPWDGPQ